MALARPLRLAAGLVLVCGLCMLSPVEAVDDVPDVVELVDLSSPMSDDVAAEVVNDITTRLGAANHWSEQGSTHDPTTAPTPFEDGEASSGGSGSRGSGGANIKSRPPKEPKERSEQENPLGPHKCKDDNACSGHRQCSIHGFCQPVSCERPGCLMKPGETDACKAAGKPEYANCAAVKGGADKQKECVKAKNDCKRAMENECCPGGAKQGDGPVRGAQHCEHAPAKDGSRPGGPGCKAELNKQYGGTWNGTKDKKGLPVPHMFSYTNASWNRIESSLIDCPLAKAKDYWASSTRRGKYGGTVPETKVDGMDVVKLFKGYAMDQEGEVEMKCEQRLPRKELLVVIDDNTFFKNDLDKKYTPTPAPRELGESESQDKAKKPWYLDAEHTDENQYPDEQKFSGQYRPLATKAYPSGKVVQDAPYKDWIARTQEYNKAYSAGHAQPTPGPTFDWQNQNRSDYHMVGLTLKDGWEVYKEISETQMETYPDGSPMPAKEVSQQKPYPTTVKEGYGNPTVSFREEICLLEGVIKPTGSESLIASLPEESACKPDQDLFFNLGGEYSGAQEGNLLGETMRDLTGVDGNFIKITTGGDIQAVTAGGGLTKWRFITISGIMWAKGSATHKGLNPSDKWEAQGAGPTVVHPKVAGKNGYCMLEGLVKRKVQPTAGQPDVIATLASDCRPVDPEYFTVTAGGGSATNGNIVTLFVDPETGNVVLYSDTYEEFSKIDWVSLSGVMFPLGQPPAIGHQLQTGRRIGNINGGEYRFKGFTTAGVTRNYLDLNDDWDSFEYDKYAKQGKKFTNTNGWKSHDYGNATFSVDADGYCRVQGMIELRPNRTAGGVIANFTEACMPIQPVVFNLRTNKGVAVVRVDELGNVIWVSSGPTNVAQPLQETKLVISLDPIAFTSNNHMRGTLGLNRRCVSGRYEGFDMPCFQTTWRDVMHHWPSKMIRAVFHDICWVGDDPIMQCIGADNKLGPCNTTNPDIAQVAEPLNFVDPFRVATICKTLKTCIEAVAYWGKAPSWEGECDAEGAAWLKNEVQRKPIPDPPVAKKAPSNLSDPKWKLKPGEESEHYSGHGQDPAWKQEGFKLLKEVTESANATIKELVDRCGEKTWTGDYATREWPSRCIELILDAEHLQKEEDLRHQIKAEEFAEMKASMLLGRTNGESNAKTECWSKKVKDGPCPGAAWNPGSLDASDPTVVWRTKMQYKPFSNPCAVMDLEMVENNFDEWGIPKENGLPFREPAPGYPQRPMDFTLTKGGMYGLDKPLEKWDWMKEAEAMAEAEEKGQAEEKREYFTKKLESSYCFLNPALMSPGMEDFDRPCPDPSSASMAVSKKVAISLHNSTFKKHSFCLSWSAVNKNRPDVMQNPEHKKLTVPYSFEPCSKMFRAKVIFQRLKWICGSADPLGWQPTFEDPVSNPKTDPIPFLIAAHAGSEAEADISPALPNGGEAGGHQYKKWPASVNYSTGFPLPPFFEPHLAEGKHRVWAKKSEVKKSCIKKKGAKYRCYKVPKYVCYPGGHMVPRIGDDGKPIKEKDGDGKFIRIRNMSAPVISAPDKYNDTIHMKDANGELLYNMTDKLVMDYKAGGVSECLEKVTETDPITGKSKEIVVVKQNNWCLNTCIDKDEIAKYIKAVTTLRKESAAINASFAQEKVIMMNRKTVLEEKIVQTTGINETVQNETELSQEIKTDTEAYYNATTVAERLKQAEKVQAAIEAKAVEERKAKEKAMKLLNITRHEEAIHKEKTKKFKEIVDKYNSKERAQKKMTREYLKAIEYLELLRYKARKTIGGWPAWVAARYYKIEAIPSGSCMYPATCEAKTFNKTDTFIKKRVSYENRNAKAAAIPSEAQGLGAWLRLYSLFGAFKGKDFGKDKSGVAKTKDAGFTTPAYTNGNIFQGATSSQAANAEVTIPGAQFLVAADFCPKEGPPGLPEMVDIMRLCEQIAYNRESRCCNKQDLSMATYIEEPLRRTYFVGDTKPWSDKKEKFTTADFLEDGKSGKIDEKTKAEARNMLFSNPKRHGRHVSYKMTKFLVQQETDTLKDF